MKIGQILDKGKKNSFVRKVIFCKKCVESNQRFMSSVQHKDQEGTQKKYASFDEHGVCLACRYFEKKKNFNWKEKEKNLEEILDKHRKTNGDYDVVVPGSGGKDSIYTSIILKEKYNMHPLTCTWAPGIYTDVGWKNYNSWINYGFDNYLLTPNKKVHRLLTKLSFLNLLHPFQPFALGQNSLPLKTALEKNIKLIVYGDSIKEKAIGSEGESKSHSKPEVWHYANSDDEIYLGGVNIKEIEQKYKIDRHEINCFLPAKKELIDNSNLEVLHLPDFINYNPQNNFYFAKQKTGFEVNPDGRTEGTYTKYQSLDDKLDGLHYYAWFIKTGRGRTTEDAALEVRNEIITREEAIMLVKKFDGEFPKKYFKDCLEYMGISENEFWETIEKFRPNNIWEKKGNDWVLKNPIWKK